MTRDYGSPPMSYYEPPDPVYWCEAGDHEIGEDEIVEMPGGVDGCQGCLESLIDKINNERKETT